MTQKEYWYWFCSMDHVNDNVKRKLLYDLGSPEALFNADQDEIHKKTGLNEEYVRLITGSRDEAAISDALNRLLSNGIGFISMNDDNFPKRLKTIDGCPMGLYYKGTLPEEDRVSVGMVGARACSGYGTEFAGKYAAKLAGCGIQVISGMALGIDSICQKSAVESGGKTYAVLGSGIDVIYPRENIELYYSIITGGGGIISEYPPGTPPLAWQFPHRNRLISGLSDTLIVMEAGKRSGTLSTAMHALNQGRDVWALPGRVNDRLSQGCNELIRDGAGILTDIDQFLESLNIQSHSSPKKEKRFQGERSRIYNAVGYEPMDITDIAQKSGADASNAAQILSELELEGVIKRVSGTYYVRS